MLVAGVVCLIPPLVYLIDTGTIGISPIFIIGVVLIVIGTVKRSQYASVPPQSPPPRPDNPDDSDGGD
jgi:hypothetical protein